jgi:hypothetical protein
MESGKKYFETDAGDEILSAEILEFAHGYQSNDFPNPQRKDCPAREDLLKIADSAELPKAELREHLLSCSPCFVEFHAAKHAKNHSPSVSKTVTVNQKSSWLAFFLRPLPAAALLIFCGALTGILLYGLLNRTDTKIAKQESVNQAEQVSQNEPAISDGQILPLENKEANLAQSSPKPDTSLTNSPNQEPKTNSEETAKLLAKKTINLDLAAAAVFRNNNSGEMVYSLPPQTVTLNVKLPANSPAGDYEVSLLDETGKPLVKNITKKSDGKNLRTELNLQNIRGRARLCITLKGEIPDCFAVSVGRAE